MSNRTTKVTLTAQVQGYVEGMEKAAKATRETGSEAEKLAQKQQAFEQLGRGAMVAGGALAAGLLLSTKAAIDWESAWAGVTKTVDGNEQEMAALEGQLRSLTSVLPATHEEIAAVAEAAGQLGINRENVASFTKTMIDLGETTNLSADQAATSIARFTNIMGTSQSQVSNLGSAMVDLGNNYATTEAEIMEMAMRLAGAGKQIGMSEGEVLGLSAALSSVGIEAEAGGSAMSKVMIDIAASAEKGGARLEMFAKVSGVSAEQFASKWKSDPGAALAMFVEGLANAEAQGMSTLGVLESLGITEVRMRDALLRSASASDQFTAAMKTGNAAFEENAALTAEAEKRYKTTAAQLSMMKNSVVDAAISIGETFLPVLEAGAEKIAGLADFIGGLPEPMIQTVSWIGAIGAAALLTGGMMLTAIPQYAKFRESMVSLNLAGGRLDKTLGLLGKAAGAAVAIGVIAALAREAEADVSGLANSLERNASATEQVGKAAEAFSGRGLGEWYGDLGAVKISVDDVSASLTNLQRSWFEQSFLNDPGTNLGKLKNTADALKLIGDELGKIATTDLGQAQTQMAKLRDEYKLSDDQMSAFINNSPELKKALEEQAAAFGLTTSDADLLKIALGEVGPAAKESGGAAKSSAEEYLDASDKANQLAGELMKLLDSYNELNGIGQSAEQQNARMQESFAQIQEYVAKAREGVEGYTLSLDESTAAGSANRAMLADYASDVLSNAQAQFELESATLGAEQASANYEARLATGRQQIYDTALALTGNADAAQKLTDKILAMPTAKEIKLLMETASAQAAIDNFIAANSQKRINIAVGAGGQGGLVVGSENGNMFTREFANGGILPGTIDSGFYQGEVHKFAETTLPWEAYISPKPGQRDRNIGIWQEAGRRLGVAQSAPAAPQINVTVHAAPGMDENRIVDRAVKKIERLL